LFVFKLASFANSKQFFLFRPINFQNYLQVKMSFKRFISFQAPRVQPFLLNHPRVISRSHNISDLLTLSKNIELRAIDATPNLQHVLNFLSCKISIVDSLLCPKKHWHFFNSVGIHCLHVIPAVLKISQENCLADNFLLTSTERLFIDFDGFAKDIEAHNNKERKMKYFVILFVLYLTYIFLAHNL